MSIVEGQNRSSVVRETRGVPFSRRPWDNQSPAGRPSMAPSRAKVDVVVAAAASPCLVPCQSSPLQVFEETSSALAWRVAPSE